MAKGKWKSVLLGIQGLVGHRQAPDYGFIYDTSLTKDAKWEIGDRVVLPDGRVFRYAKSGSAINVDRACEFAEDEVQGWTVLDSSESGVVGDKSILVNGGTHAELTKDQLRGGYVIIFKDGGGGYTQFRGIVGNVASAEDADMRIYLDAPLDVATVGGTTACEVFYNPYADLRDGGTAELTPSKAGKAAVQVLATLTYFWVQTWGPCWIAPNVQTASFATAYNRAAYFRADGSIEAYVAQGSRDTDHPNQLAGYLINEGYSAGPLLNLMINP